MPAVGDEHERVHALRLALGAPGVQLLDQVEAEVDFADPAAVLAYSTMRR